MEWVEVTAKTVEEAKHQALDRLGVDVDDAEFEVLQQPSKGLFGMMRGEARVRARVRPTAVRPKRERRERGKTRDREGSSRKRTDATDGDDRRDVTADESSQTDDAGEGRQPRGSGGRRPRQRGAQGTQRSNGKRSTQEKEKPVSDTSTSASPEPGADAPVDPAAVGEAAATFVTGLAGAFGLPTTAEVVADGSDLEVRVSGGDLGLLIGPGGRTLTAVQDLTRVAAQRKLGDHETRLKIDIAGYREKRREALEKFTRTVAADVLASGRPKALEPMSSADRKIVHDAVTEIDGVVSRSDGDDPARRVIISPS